MSSKRSSARRSDVSGSDGASPWAAFRHETDLYARRVLGDEAAGAPILAGPLVRLACERHLRDRTLGAQRGLMFDGDRASRPIAFFKKFLRFPDGLHAGAPFVLQPWQAFIVGSLFGWLGPDGLRRFRTAYVEGGKGCGKTPIAAAVGIFMLIADGEPSAQVLAAAVSADQARILFHDAERFVEASPLLKQRIDRSVNNLADPTSFSWFRPVSSEHRSLDGKRVHCGLIDELHEHRDSLVVDKVRAGTKGRPQALIFEITNSGYDRTSVCWAHHEHSRQVLEGALENDSWFAYVAGLDEADDPLTDRRCWVKANPNLGVSITDKYLEEQVAEAVGMPSKANLVLRLNFCVWTQAHTRAIDLTRWSACQPMPTDAELRAAQCFAGLDLGMSDDFTAFVRVWPLSDGRVAVRSRFWIPQAALEQYRTRPYDMWRRAGALEITEGNVTDYDVVERAVLEDCRASRVRQLGFDKRFASQLAQHLQGHGLELVDVPQGFALNEAITRMLELVAEGELCHGHDPILTWMASNVVLRHGRLGEVRLDKDAAADKIDGFAALAMALTLALRAPVRKRQIGVMEIA